MATVSNPSDDEYIFVEYHDVIKSFKPYILKKICEKEYRDNYDSFIDYTQIENKSIEELNGLVQKSVHLNILKSICKAKFDFDLTYYELCSRFSDIAYESKPMVMASSGLKVLLLQKFTKNVYVHTEDYDKRVEDDIKNLFLDDRVEYVYGPFEECVNKIPKITSYILNDIDYVDKLIAMKRIAYTSVLVANYGYNYKLDDDGKLTLYTDNIDDKSTTEIFKFAMFMPFNDVKI